MVNRYKNFIIACIVLFYSSSYAGAIINSYQTVASGGACDTVTFTHSGTPDAEYLCGRTSDDYYVGAYTTFAQAGDKCKITLTLTAQGSITGYTYNVIIATRDGNDIDTILGTSTGVTGNDSWSDSQVEFEFSSSVTVTTASNNYIVSLTANEITGTSNYTILECVTGGSANLYGVTHNSIGGNTGSSSKDALMVIYE